MNTWILTTRQLVVQVVHSRIVLILIVIVVISVVVVVVVHLVIAATAIITTIRVDNTKMAIAGGVECAAIALLLHVGSCRE